MRTKKSLLNLIISFSSQLILLVLGFVSRKVLIYNVGVDYLGINGLMTNILLLFSLAESGIGVAIGYSLYKPLANNDKELIKSLMRFYKKSYEFLAIFTAVVGLCFYPFLNIFIKGSNIDDVNIIYFLFLFSSISSYLFSYKVTLNNCDQNKYIYTIANTITQIIVLIIKVIILYYTKNYLLFLCIDIISTLLKNIIFSKIVDTNYPYLKEKNIKQLDKKTKQNLFQNIKALFIGKIGYIISQSSDNLVISSMISVSTVGLYSNYTILVTSVSGFVSMFVSSITASMGNLIASESKEKQYSIFKKVDFINDWLYISTSVCLLCLIEPFIVIWLGDEFLMGRSVLIISVLLYFFKGISSNIEMIKNTSGLFYPDRYVTIIEALLNLVISIILAKRYQLTGVLFGTLISYLLISFWIKPFLVYKYIFHKNFNEFIKRLILKIFIFVVIYFISVSILNSIQLNDTLFCFFIKASIIFIISNLLITIFYHKELVLMKEYLIQIKFKRNN